MQNRYARKKVYECMNSWGFEQPLVYIEVDHLCIKLVMKIDAVVTPLTYTNAANHDSTGTHGSGCNGQCFLSEDSCYPLKP